MELIIERDTKTLSKNELMELGMIQKDMWAF